MSDKIKELLGVLDMAERERYLIVLALCDESPASRGCPSLADLAFRLRDEAVKKCDWRWTEGCKCVFDKHCPDSTAPEVDFDIWWADSSQPIHWIIAALIAKELEKKEDK